MSSITTPLKEKVAKFLSEMKTLYINGQFVKSVSEKTFDTIDPSTGEVLATIYEGQKEDIDLAVKAARDAFDKGPWGKMNPAVRSRLMYKLADLMEENKEELAQIETLDNGKPIRETLNVDVPLAIEHLRYYAGWATKVTGQTIPVNGRTNYPLEFSIINGLVEIGGRTSNRLYSGFKTSRTNSPFLPLPGRVN